MFALRRKNRASGPTKFPNGFQRYEHGAPPETFPKNKRKFFRRTGRDIKRISILLTEWIKKSHGMKWPHCVDCKIAQRSLRSKFSLPFEILARFAACVQHGNSPFFKTSLSTQ